MDTYGVLSALALMSSLAGNVLVNFKKKIGFVVWSLSNILWVAVNLLAEQTNWFQIAMFVVYMGLNIHGFIMWSKRNENI